MEQADRDRRLSEAFVEISEKRSRRIDTKADGSCLYHALVRLIRVERRWDLLGQPDAPLPESACENIGWPGDDFELARTLRGQVLDYIRARPAYFAPLITQTERIAGANDRETIELYVLSREGDGGHGGQVEMEAAAQLLKRASSSQ